MTTLTKLNLSRRFDMRFINLILSNFIGQLTTSMVESMVIHLGTVSTRFIKPHAFGPRFDKSSRDLYLGV